MLRNFFILATVTLANKSISEQVGHPNIESNGPFVDQLGLETGPQGEIKVSSPFNETSVHGVFAAGDVASQLRVVPNAIYGGSLVGAGLVAQLLAEKAQTSQG